MLSKWQRSIQLEIVFVAQVHLLNLYKKACNNVALVSQWPEKVTVTPNDQNLYPGRSFFSLWRIQASIWEFLGFRAVCIRQRFKKKIPWLQKRLFRQTGVNTSGVVNINDILCRLRKIKHCFQWRSHLRTKLRTEVYDRISSKVIAKTTEVTAVYKASIEYQHALLF